MKLHSITDHCVWRHSFFVRLIGIIILTGAVLITIAHFSLKNIFESHIENIVQHMVKGHASYIVDDIGVPPDTVRAASVTERSHWQLVYQGPQFSWQSDEDIPIYDDLPAPLLRIFSYAGDDFGIYLGRIYTRVVRGEHTYYFCSDIESSFKHLYENLFLYIFIAIGCILTIMYLFIKHQLRPLKALLGWTENVSKGNLDYRVTVKSHNEFGMLASSFNTMADKIEDMVKSKEQLLLDVSHELRSPLTRSKVALEFMEEGKAKDSVLSDLEEMSIMINEILESERLSSDYGKLSLEKGDLRQLLDFVIADEGTKKVSLVNFPNEALVTMDLQRIKIVLKNVITNALKYSHDSGKSVEISGYYDKDYFNLVVKDFGNGIPESEIPFVFEPFYRVDKSRSRRTGGYGLGLSLCRKIMDLHKGTIELTSTVNESTTVTVKFNINI